VCKLVKSLYGLKQESKQWHQKFNKIIAQFGFTIHEHEKCIYSRKLDNDYTIFCLYVDNILIFGTSLDAIQRVKDYLSQNFNMKDLGSADMILRMQISRTPNEISLSLSHCIERMLQNFDFYYSKSISTLYDPSIALKNMGKHVSQLKYSQLIGSLFYISNKTRPDISYAVGRLSRITSNPSREHWTALERVFRYLRKIIGYCLTYIRYPDVIEGYSDANWVTDSHSVKFTIRYVFIFGGDIVP